MKNTWFSFVTAKKIWIAAALLMLVGGIVLVSLKRHAELAEKMAVLPVVSMDEDGKIHVNGHELAVTLDASPPPMLELIEGGPPQELAEKMHGVNERMTETVSSRQFIYPRTGIILEILKKVVGEKVRVMFHLKLDLKEVGRRPGVGFRGTFEFRGQRWWMTEEVFLSQRDIFSILRESDLASLGRAEWIMTQGDVNLTFIFDEHGRLGCIEAEVFADEK